MRKWIRKVFLDPLEFLPLLFVYGFFRALPLSFSSSLAGHIARIFGPFLPAHKIGQTNLQKAFPKKSISEREDILEKAWENLGRVVGEFPHLKKISKSRVEVIDLCDWEKTQKKDVPVMFFSAHMANWEVPHMLLTNKNIEISLLSRPPNNWITRWFFGKVRTNSLVSIILKGPEGSKDFLKTLMEKRNLGILLDQRLSEGEKIPFFGRPAYTPVGPARFAEKFNAALIPVQIERMEGVRFKVTYHKPLKTHKDFLKTSLEINQTFEQWITKNPDQWLWFHNRWKL